MKITIYHNPRCSKSRATLELVRAHGIQPQIVEYMATPPSPDTLLQLAAMLEVPLKDLLRTSERDFAASVTPVPVDDGQALAEWLHEHPQVLQRPIVVDAERNCARIGRPPENVLDLLPK